MSQVVKLGKRCQVVIPKKIRERLGVTSEDELIISVHNGQIIMQPKARRYSEHMRGLGKSIWEGIDATEYVRQEREAWKD